LCTVGRHACKSVSSYGVIGINGEDVFQTDTLILKAVGDSAEPQPGMFVVSVEFDDVQKYIIGFRALTGLRTCHPTGQQPVDLRSS
jgi:hypothetical protein